MAHTLAELYSPVCSLDGKILIQTAFPRPSCASGIEPTSTAEWTVSTAMCIYAAHCKSFIPGSLRSSSSWSHGRCTILHCHSYRLMMTACDHVDRVPARLTYRANGVALQLSPLAL
jgi:hypothetical protein